MLTEVQQGERSALRLGQRQFLSSGSIQPQAILLRNTRCHRRSTSFDQFCVIRLVPLPEQVLLVFVDAPFSVRHFSGHAFALIPSPASLAASSFSVPPVVQMFLPLCARSRGEVVLTLME